MSGTTASWDSGRLAFALARTGCLAVTPTPAFLRGPLRDVAGAAPAPAVMARASTSVSVRERDTSGDMESACDQGTIDRAHVGTAAEGHAERQLLAKHVQDTRDPLTPGRRHPPEAGTPDQSRPGAERYRLDHVGAAAHASVHEALGPARHRLDHARQR